MDSFLFIMLSIFLIVFIIRLKALYKENKILKTRYNLLVEKLGYKELLISHLGEESEEQIKKLLNESKEFEALKLLKKELNIGLFEAKNYIDTLKNN